MTAPGTAGLADSQQAVLSLKGFAHAVARRWWRQNPDVPLDDLAQAAWLGFCEAARRFDPAGGHKLITYARYWGENLCREEVRRHAAAGVRVPYRRGVTRVPHASLNAPIPGGEGVDGREWGATLAGRETEPWAAAEEADEARALWARVRRCLTAAQYRLLRDYLVRGRTFREISRELGVSHQAAQQSYHTALRAVRAKLTGVLRPGRENP